MAMKKKMDTVGHYSLTIDSWTSVATKSYVAVTLHGVSTSWELESFLLDLVPVEESETARYLAGLVRGVLHRWEIDIERVVAITSDGASNVKAAIANELDIEWIYCLAHQINRSIRLALDAPDIKPIIDRAKAIAKTFKRSSNAKRMLAERQRALGLRVKSLKIDNKTRWGSAHKMLKRLVSSRPAVSACLGALHGLRRPIPDDLTSPQWVTIERLAKILEPLKKATKFVSSQTVPTIGAAMPLVSRATSRYLKAGDGDSTRIASFKQNVSDDLTARWNLLEQHASDTLLLAVYLDPRFKTFAFIDDVSKRHTLLDKAASLASTLVSTTTAADADRSTGRTQQRESTTLSPYAKVMDDLFGEQVVPVNSAARDVALELSHYRNRPDALRLLPDKKTILDPLAWWKQHQLKYPRLAVLARRYLSVISTSVPAERVFSKGGWTVNKRRCALSDESVSILVFLSCNKAHRHT